MPKASFTRPDLRKILGDAHTQEIEDAIMNLYLSVVDPLKDALKSAQAKADQADELQGKLDALEKEDYKGKYEEADKALKEYKAAEDAKAARAAKETAARAYFKDKIADKNLALAIRAAAAEIDGLELDKDGKIKDASKLDALVGKELASLAVKTKKEGANPATPPSGEGGKLLTREEIYATDDKGRYKLTPTQRQNALAAINAAEKG